MGDRADVEPRERKLRRRTDELEPEIERVSIRERVRKRSVDAYVFLIVGLAVAVIWREADRGLMDIGGRDRSIFLFFAALLILGELRPIRWLLRVDGGEVTATWSFALALVLLDPGVGPLIAIAVASAVGDMVHRKPVLRVLFNVAQMVLSIEAAVLIVRATGAGDLLLVDRTLTVWWLLATAAAGAAAFVLNGVLTSVVFSLAQARPLLLTLRAAVASNTSIDGMLLALSPILVVVAERSLVLVPLLLVTVWVVYRNAHAALARQHEATHDVLTGLPNRRLFMEQLSEEIERAERRGEMAAIVVMDLDGFKELNDRLGHETGDLTLQAVAERLLRVRRAGDLVARLGGDEFACILRGTKDETAATALAERLHEQLQQPLTVDGFPVSVAGSLGVALYPIHGREVSDLLAHADTAMYTAKRTRRGVMVSATTKTSSRSRRSLLGDLGAALDKGEVTLHFQPQLDLRTARVDSVEALCRWAHPTLGAIGPDEFIPLAEHTELMVPFTEYILELAAGHAARWAKAGFELTVAVNASSRNASDTRFPELVCGALERHGLAPGTIEIEITENAVLHDVLRTTEVLHALREQGVRVALDDFGTGFSSLTNLRQLPVDVVKIDKTFVKRLVASGADQLLVRSIIQLVHGLGLEVVAEGVEDEDTAALLSNLGCELIQGYYLSKPMAADEVTPWVDGWRRFGMSVVQPRDVRPIRSRRSV